MEMPIIILVLVLSFPLLAWMVRPGWSAAVYVLAAYVSFYFIFSIMAGFVFGILSLYLSAYFEWINVALAQECMALVAYALLFTLLARAYFKEFGDGPTPAAATK